MTATRRMGPKGSPTWHAMLDAVEAILRDEGYGQLTSRRVAEQAGVKQRLVYYYFHAMDDLVVASFVRLAARESERLADARASASPVREIWKVCLHTADARLISEFTALANRIAALRAEVLAYVAKSRRIQIDAITEAVGRSPTAATMPPAALALLAGSLSLALMREADLGIDTGHAEILSAVEECLNALEPANPVPVPAPAKSGQTGAQSRTAILDATENVLIEEGYAAVTTRRVAERAGVKAPLVHYYYKTIDDLLIATYQRAAEQSLKRHTEAAALEDVLGALWEVNVEPGRTTLAIEFMALANHRKFIAEEIRRYAEQARAIQVVALNNQFAKQGLSEHAIATLPLTVVLAGVARALVMEGGIGITLGHSETRQVVFDLLRRFTGDVPDEPS